jgi:nucleoside-diphosphate-sugar epimerase
MSGKILITGAFGKVGSALAQLPGEKVLMDLRIPVGAGSNVIQAAVQDREALQQALRGCSSIVHLAASPDVDSPWEAVLENNIQATHVLLDAAKKAGVERIIFASTNHVVGMVEIENAPGIYEPGHGIMLSRDAEARPDSYYGVSKLLGENLGRFFSENGGPRFYTLRIGAVHAEWEDHPYAEAQALVRSGVCKPGDALYELKVKRQKALWLSRRDLVQLVERCLAYNGEQFDIFYGVSNNPTRWLDIEYARQKLGYEPNDNAALWVSAPESEKA